MSIQLTRSGKNTLYVENPVLNAAGTMGYADEYRHLIALEKLGALVTNPVTLAPRAAANGTRVVPLDAGLLLHTGLPNDGIRRVIETYREAWARMPIPVIVHLAAASSDDLARCLDALEAVDSVAGIEIGVQDDTPARDAARWIGVAARSDKPVLFRLPFGVDESYAAAMADAGAGGLTMSAPPRGTARDAAGKLVAGRLYGTWVHPLNLQIVSQIARKVNLPVIACGGIHSADHARTYLNAGAVAVQIDSLAWARPTQVEMIARDLGGLVSTQPAGAFPDEWYPGMSDSEPRGK
ncbi:MAG: hypothetical protein IAE89_13430 [Anaerolineae bacterium]|nr:hypothetical protein [Anaerolineae bacterium]